jgi:CBS domain-containing protein
VVGEDNELVGIVTRHDLQGLIDTGADFSQPTLQSVLKREATVAYPDESLRMIVYRMAETGLTRFPVVDRSNRRLVGMIGLADLLKARAMNLDAERRRERVLGAHITLPFGIKREARAQRL